MGGKQANLKIQAIKNRAIGMKTNNDSVCVKWESVITEKKVSELDYKSEKIVNQSLFL